MKQVVSCPQCRTDVELHRFVPQPDSRAEVTSCRSCDETFAFSLAEIIELPETATATQAA